MGATYWHFAPSPTPTPAHRVWAVPSLQHGTVLAAGRGVRTLWARYLHAFGAYRAISGT
jgi:hypothetical protein